MLPERQPSGRSKDPPSKLASSFEISISGPSPQMNESHFCQQICCLLCLRILNYGYTNHRQHKKRARDERTRAKSKGTNFLLYLFFLKLNFPFRNTRNFGTSLGILRVKPEVFHFSAGFYLQRAIPPLRKDDKIDRRAQSGTKNREIECLSMTSAVACSSDFAFIHLGGDSKGSPGLKLGAADEMAETESDPKIAKKLPNS